MTSNQRDDRVVERYYVGSWCWPFADDRGAALFWGAALLSLGGVWLAANTIGLDNWGEWLIPALFVVWGAVLLLGFRSERRGGRRRGEQPR
jgi:hypothetical protein